jgi:thymidine kinase
MIKLEIKKKPDLKKVEFICDKPIHKKLEKYDLINDFFNKSNTTAIIGNPGQGKTSLLIHFIEIYEKCFQNIYVFMAESSRNSLKKNIFTRILNQNNLFESVTLENLDYVYENIKEDSLNDEWSLIIFDDVQSYFKDGDIVKELSKIVANRRHLRVVNFLILQNFKALHANIRKNITNLILFNLDKTQTEDIYEEFIKIKKPLFEKICDFVYKEPHDWLFIHIPTMTFYKQFDKIVIDK